MTKKKTNQKGESFETKYIKKALKLEKKKNSISSIISDMKKE